MHLEGIAHHFYLPHGQRTPAFAQNGAGSANRENLPQPCHPLKSDRARSYSAIERIDQ